MKLRAEGRTYSSETFNRKKRKAAGKADSQQGGRPKKKVKVKSSQRNKAPYNVRAADTQHTTGHISRLWRHSLGAALPAAATSHACTQLP